MKLTIKEKDGVHTVTWQSKSLGQSRSFQNWEEAYYEIRNILVEWSRAIKN